MFNIVMKDLRTSFECNEQEDVLTAAIRQGIDIPVGCRGGGCGMCRIHVIEGNIGLGTYSKTALTEKDVLEKYSLACKTYVRSDLQITLG